MRSTLPLQGYPFGPSPRPLAGFRTLSGARVPPLLCNILNAFWAGLDTLCIKKLTITKNRRFWNSEKERNRETRFRGGF